MTEAEAEQAQFQATTVPVLLEQFNLKSFDFLKMDVEGAEKKIFSESSPWLSQAQLLMVETHDIYVSGTEHAVLARMKSEKLVRQAAW